MRNAFWVILAIGCGSAADKSEDTGTPGTDDPGPTGDFSEYINTTNPYIGDLDCFTGTLGVETASTGCAGQTRTMSAEIDDFQSGDVVDEATVEIFLADGIVGQAFDCRMQLFRCFCHKSFRSRAAL